MCRWHCSRQADALGGAACLGTDFGGDAEGVGDGLAAVGQVEALDQRVPQCFGFGEGECDGDGDLHDVPYLQMYTG